LDPRKKPDVQVILTSGVERSANIAATLCEAGPLLEKSYPPQDVVDRIKQLVAKTRSSDGRKR
jgi:3-deoxy-D-manno-octulosonic-acid transferase